jgi:hypothetical protein
LLHNNASNAMQDIRFQWDNASWKVQIMLTLCAESTEMVLV